ncbi:MAG: rhodanese-like domain-containing protein [Bacteroidetes bacterium]|nr:rhodanese-like domain-containing protein [Bacteroidota bacterium]
MNIEELIKEKKGSILDVRTPEEFMGGHVSGSVNIPLHDLNTRLEEVKLLNKPIVLCCASGGRSGVAHGFLNELGIESYNGGSWMDVNYLQSK